MEQMRKDLDQVTANIRNLEGAMHYLSQRTAWNENCFKQVQDSGVLQMNEALRKVMTDHKKLLIQINILTTRLTAMQGESGDNSGGAQLPLLVKPSMKR